MWMGLLFLAKTAKASEDEVFQRKEKLRAERCFRVDLTVLKVEPVEVHPLYQVAQRLRLERSQSRVADLAGEERGRRDNKLGSRS